jgi:hypothetical protein
MAVARVATLSTSGGVLEDVADVTFSSNVSMAAFSGLFMVDSLTDFDSDNASAVDFAYFDGNTNNRTPFISSGPHWGAAGARSNFHVPAVVRTGRSVRFRLRTFHPSDLSSAGFGVVLSLP